MQTLRITEFFLLINSKNCISGKTALARLNALCHKKLTQEALAKLFDKNITINHRKKNRLGDVIKWMKNISLEIRENTEDKSDILNQIHQLSQVLQNKTTSNQHIIAYTETKKRKSRNSGYGIHITTSSHSPILTKAEGKAWIFFIFAVCDWLPLNYRIHSHSNVQRTICNLCQGNSAETIEHLFLCPALREEQNSLRENIDVVFKKWSIPYSSIGHLPGSNIKSHWVKMLQSKLSKSLGLSH